MKDYYAILRVSRSADIQTIKRSYRLLVQRYHPDVNPDPQAAELIREINEAYDVLSDSVKKSEYDYRLVNPYQTYTQQQQPEEPSPLRNRDPYFKRRGFRPVFRRPTQYDLVLRYFHYVKKVCVSGLVVCLILLIDYNLPHIHRTVSITIDYRAGTDYLFFEGRYIPVLQEEFRSFEDVTQVELVESRLLRKIIEIRTLDGANAITTFGSVYGTFKFVPIIVFITALICLLMRDNEEFRFGLCVLTGFALFFTLVLMF
ncbi:MAG TPA: DnaJ domain-containing protein [Cyclobacteriaceae bacterium]|nr:DnaJ domain-containing protein [Cyclobacteriaceae bacterium]HMV10342.1 DnaJ domain-containing protein [Cyclobacteriaceae bacterium]HMX02751.1 DnaJ domain-containing protein [Cyclobacteriaceae bacterium]HMX50095.1 DnaJ domain-containing protein [Cyclobacteriaceae bacterium]HMY92524.1 DnaJ domain-containing protein [Cyclobacteriaceae bacterium]